MFINFICGGAREVVVSKEAVISPLAVGLKWKAKGVHHIDALLGTGKGGLGTIVEGTKKPLGPSGLGYYEAKVMLYHKDFPDLWKVKDSRRGMSTFFPDHWTADKLRKEFAYALVRKRHDKGNGWLGRLSDEVEIMFRIDDGIIKSAYPNF